MEFIASEIQEYAEKFTSVEPVVLTDLDRETNLKHLLPRMLSGHLQGRILSMFSCMIKPKKILEIGTYTGYSAICLAEGLQKDGILHTIDCDVELEGIALKHFETAGYKECIKMHIGNALKIIPVLGDHFDLVYLDADKVNYCNYYELVIERLSPGGFIIADNVLWSGKVLNSEEHKSDEETQGIIAFNKKVIEDKRVSNVLMPVRDGLQVIRRNF